MLAFFRTLISSRLGALIGVVFLVLIALAFAGADVGGMRTGSLIGGERVATVGNASISTGDLDKTVRTAFEAERQRTPTLSLKDFIGQGALDEVLNGLVERYATQVWGAKYGIGLTDRLVDSEIAKLPAFQGPDGKFSQNVYDQMLAQRGLTDKLVRDDIAKGLMARQVFAGSAQAGVMPTTIAQRYAALFKERRDGSILLIPAEAYAPKAPPSPQQLAAFYQGNTPRYARPEHRTLRYIIVDDAALKTLPTPSDAEIAARYKLNAAAFAPSETRSITQVIVPAEAAARALAADIAGGKSLEAAAAARGLVPSKITDKTHDSLATESSKALADSVFAGAPGKLAPPAKAALGWAVARVDAVKKNPGKTLAEARGEIATALATEKRHAALTELGTRIGEQLEAGTSLNDVAKAHGLVVQTSDPVQADGTIAGKPTVKAPDDLLPLLQTAFAMEREGQPQIATLAQGARFVAFEVGAITPAAPAPLAEIHDQVAHDWALDQGAAAAKVLADKVLAGLDHKQSLDAAAHAAGLAQAKIEPVSVTREQLAGMQGRVPAPLALLFTLKEGNSRKIEGANHAGWLIVNLAKIQPGEVTAADPLVTTAAAQLGQVVGREYEEQLRTAITREVGSRRNETAIRQVRNQLAGVQ